VEAKFLTVLVLSTTAGGYLIGWWRGRLPGLALVPALRSALSLVASVCGWLAINLAVGMVIILAARAAGRFVTIYVLNDVTLVGLSALQGLLFTSWRRRAAADRASCQPPGRPPGPRGSS
jgi:hypothetical protein